MYVYLPWVTIKPQAVKIATHTGQQAHILQNKGYMYFAQRHASYLGLFRRGRYPLGIACAGSNPVGDGATTIMSLCPSG